MDGSYDFYQRLGFSYNRAKSSKLGTIICFYFKEQSHRRHLFMNHTTLIRVCRVFPEKRITRWPSPSKFVPPTKIRLAFTAHSLVMYLITFNFSLVK